MPLSMQENTKRKIFQILNFVDSDSFEAKKKKNQSIIYSILLLVMGGQGNV